VKPNSKREKVTMIDTHTHNTHRDSHTHSHSLTIHTETHTHTHVRDAYLILNASTLLVRHICLCVHLSIAISTS